MGVLNLWKILNPTCQPVKLNDLKNKTLAVDLSIWICENSNIKFNTNNTKPHLRALFFRCKSLLEIGCELIFVREGDVIELKQDTMQKRNQARFGSSQVAASQISNFSASSQAVSSSQFGSQSQSSQSKPIKKRNRFDHVADECCELLKSMGINVIRSPCGEAEKACAYLNLIGRVDGVITDDSDVFLYGAKTVYRNFCLDKKSEISIEEYKIDKIERDLGYTREFLIVLALLLGCDYDAKGIPGVGKECACKFLNELVELRKQDVNFDIFDVIKAWPKKDYQSNGLKYEDRIRKLVVSNSDGPKFPNESIIREYMHFSKMTQLLLTQEKYLAISWNRPNLRSCQILNEIKQAWPYDYTASKLVPLIILHEYNNKKAQDKDIKPIKINKTKRKAFNDYYEVVWSKMSSSIDEDLSELTEYITLENPEVFEKHYASLVTEFKSQIEAKKATRKKKKQVIELDTDDEQNPMDSIMILYENYTLNAENINLDLSNADNGDDNEEEIRYNEIEDLPNHNYISNSQQVEMTQTQTQKNIELSTKKKKKKAEAKNKENIDTDVVSKKPPKNPDIKIKKLKSKTVEAKSNQNKFNNDDEIVVLDEDHNDNQIPCKPPTLKKKNDYSIDGLVSSFENIEIKNDNLDKEKKQTDSSDSDTDKNNVPFSMRMKQLYNKASIFNN